MNRNNKIGLAILLTPFVGAFAGAVLFGNPEQNSASAQTATPAQQEFVAVATQEPVLRPKPRPTPEAVAQADSGSSWLLQLTGGEKVPAAPTDSRYAAAESLCNLWFSAAEAARGVRFWPDLVKNTKWDGVDGIAKFQYQSDRGLDCKVIFEGDSPRYASLDRDGNILHEERF